MSPNKKLKRIPRVFYNCVNNEGVFFYVSLTFTLNIAKRAPMTIQDKVNQNFKFESSYSLIQIAISEDDTTNIRQKTRKV